MPGRTLHVSPSGSDSNPGTQAAPFKTIEKASEGATPGTTVLVAPGTYAGSFNTESSGSWLAPIVYRSEKKWEAKLVGTEEEEHTWRNEGDHVIIEGFFLSGGSEDGLIESGSYVQVVGNILHGFIGNCVTTYPYDIHDVDFVGNVTFGCGLSEQDHGIYLGYSGGRVFNNISHGNGGYGIHCWHNCNRMVISNNLLFNNQGGGMVIGQGDAPNEGRVKADDFLVSNNIVMHNLEVGIEEHGATGSRNRFVNNTVFQNAGNDFELQSGVQSGTLVDDPRMVDYRPDGLGDYRLLPASSSVNSGIPLGAPPVDIRGLQRPLGGGHDRGVFEEQFALL